MNGVRLDRVLCQSDIFPHEFSLRAQFHYAVDLMIKNEWTMCATRHVTRPDACLGEQRKCRSGAPDSDLPHSTSVPRTREKMERAKPVRAAPFVANSQWRRQRPNASIRTHPTYPPRPWVTRPARTTTARRRCRRRPLPPARRHLPRRGPRSAGERVRVCREEAARWAVVSGMEAASTAPETSTLLRAEEDACRCHSRHGLIDSLPCVSMLSALFMLTFGR